MTFQKFMEAKTKDNDIVVSILCAAYNHEEFISDALDSFLKQKTNFAFEIIVNEDCSTDSTASILKRYEKEYPNIVRVIYQKENQYSKGISVLDIMVSYSRGKYIATCEGDDYWVDELKLQKQVDYMEMHPDCSLVGHANYVVSKQKEIIKLRRDCPENSEVNLITDGGYMHFATRLAKREVYTTLPRELHKKYYQGVAYIYYAHLLGYLFYDGNPMSVWRVNDNSVTHSLYLGSQKSIDIYRDYLSFYKRFDSFSQYRYHKSILLRESEQIVELVLKARRYLPRSVFKELKKEESFKIAPLRIKAYITLMSFLKTKN